jgi:RNA polymerase sigma-70 factor (ECF subfamily)
VDESEFEDWYLRHHARMVNSLYLLCGDTDLARDAADEAFARAAARWARVGAMDSPIGWTYRVAVNRVRKNARRHRREHELWETQVRPQHQLSSDIAYVDVWEAVRALPPKQCASVILRYVADQPEAEIARILGASRSTVASNLARARATLAVTLAPEPEEQKHSD